MSDEQTITSAATDLRQIPSILRIGDERGYWVKGTVNFDMGGGASDIFTHALKRRGVTNLVADPFNRSLEHNLSVTKQLIFIEGANSATMNNVMNVINADDVLYLMALRIFEYLRPGGRAYFTVYEGTKTGVGIRTIKGYQRNEYLASYLDFVTESFGVENVTLRYPVIEAVKHPVARPHPSPSYEVKHGD